MIFGLQPGDRALVVAPHIDDETLGLAGTIIRLARAGVLVDVLAVACTTAPMYGGTSDTAVRLAELDSACQALGVRRHEVAWCDDHRAANPGAHLPELIQLLEAGVGVSLAATRPRVLFLPSGQAHHQDHRAVHEAGIAAARPGDPRSRWIPPTVVGYDGPEDRCWRAMGERPLLVDVSDCWSEKEKALSAYASQLRDAPHPRSIEVIRALDVAAGAAIGTELAERFLPYRMVFS